MQNFRLELSSLGHVSKPGLVLRQKVFGLFALFLRVVSFPSLKQCFQFGVHPEMPSEG